jgi:putative transposase
MAGTYAETYYHLVWRTKESEPYISSDLEPHLYAYLRSRCSGLGVFVHALNGMPDHVHLVCSVPPSIAVAAVMKQLKGASAHFVNHHPELEGRLYWQDGYGVLTLAKRDLPRVVAYVLHQKEHHREPSIHEDGAL